MVRADVSWQRKVSCAVWSSLVISRCVASMRVKKVYRFWRRVWRLVVAVWVRGRWVVSWDMASVVIPCW